MKTSIWIKITFVVIVIYSTYWIINRSGENITITKVTNENFQYEVLESPIPAVVIFCNDKLWNRKSVPWSREEPAPVILAIREIMKEEQYKGKVRFWMYAVPESSYNRIIKSFSNDPLCKEFNIKWLPTVIIFKNSGIVKKLEGGGCTVEESKRKIEQELRKILQ